MVNIMYDEEVIESKRRKTCFDVQKFILRWLNVELIKREEKNDALCDGLLDLN